MTDNKNKIISLIEMQIKSTISAGENFRLTQEESEMQTRINDLHVRVEGRPEVKVYGSTRSCT